jgi:hypothetical protein
VTEALPRLDALLAEGVTTIEIKSGMDSARARAQQLSRPRVTPRAA